MGWFKQLGATRTAADPTGRRHHLGFIAFVVGMVLLIVALGIWRANAANAGGGICRGPISYKNPDFAGTGSHWVKLTLSRWCGTSQPGARWDGGAPSYSREQSEGLLWSFNKWFDTKVQTGTGQAPNGQTNVQYKAVWVAAEFKQCWGVGPATVCTHDTDGVRMWAWANGNYTQRGTEATPNLPMPKP